MAPCFIDGEMIAPFIDTFSRKNKLDKSFIAIFRKVLTE